MVRLARRALLWVAIALLAMEVLYLLGANIYLNTSLGRERFNRKPDRFQIHWSSAWSWWPGTVNLRDVQTGGRSKRVAWDAHLDTVTATYDLAPLRHRTVHLRSVSASGVRYLQRREPRPGEPAPAVEDLPPLREFPDRTASRAGPATGRDRSPWTVLADAITCDADEVWIDRWRLTGPIRVETSMSLRVRGPLEFPRVRVTMASGELKSGPKVVFAGLGMDFDASIHPFGTRSARKPRFFRNLSGHFGLRSPRASLFFLEAYFRKVPWLHFDDWAAGKADLRLDHGRLQPGSTLEVSNDQVDMRVLNRRITGRGSILGTIEEVEGSPLSRLLINLKEFQLAPVGTDDVYARGRDATVLAVSRSTDLSDPFTDVEVSLDLPEIRILDLAFYNRMLPDSSTFRFESGTGIMRYHLEGSQSESSLHGHIEVVVEDGVARYRNHPLRGGFVLHTPLRQGSPREMLFDISGTRLDLRAAGSPWTATIELPAAKLRFTEPIQTGATIRLRMTDTRPLVAMFDAVKGVPSWVERMITIERIRGGARLDVDGERIALTDLEVTGEGLRALADLTLGKGTRKGIFYIDLHGISLGVAVNGNERDLKLIRPLTWFERTRAERSSRAARRRDGNAGR